MITLTIYGLDQFVVGDLSKEITPLLAELYECDEDDINFIAPNCMVFHKGEEQTSWDVLVRVHAPLKVTVLQDKAAQLIMHTVKGPAIHISVEFYYYSQDNRYQLLDDTYPRFISEDNSVSCEDNNVDEYVEGEGEDEIYTGNIFKDFNKGRK